MFPLKGLNNNSPLIPFVAKLEKLTNLEYSKKNSNKNRWQNSLNQLKTNKKLKLTKKLEYLFVNQLVDKSALIDLKPWRKGPYSFKNLKLKSEWNGDIKWQRLKDKINFKNKQVLDVGCGNGYFSMLMSLSGAKEVLGLEPFLLFNYQFQAIKSLTNNLTKVNILPLKLEQVDDMAIFDIVVSMGVLYHQKSPIEHILKLKKMLTSGGELVLETLVVKGIEGYSLTPKTTYAKMRNVWFIPSIKTLINWLLRCGFKKITIIDDNKTTSLEQRKTKWIGDNAQSLIDFIDGNKTIEGYLPPRRLMLICKENSK